MSQARAVRCALNQTRNIRQHNVLAVAADDAQIRRQRREVVVADFRLCARHDGQNRRFADVRIAHKTHVRNRFEFQQEGVDFRLMPGLAKFGACRVGVAKWRLPQPPRPPCSNRARFARCVHIRNHRAGFRLADDCPDRYFDDEVFTALARAVACRAVHAVFRRVFALEAEIQQRVHV